MKLYLLATGRLGVSCKNRCHHANLMKSRLIINYINPYLRLTFRLYLITNPGKQCNPEVWGLSYCGSQETSSIARLRDGGVV